MSLVGVFIQFLFSIDFFLYRYVGGSEYFLSVPPCLPFAAQISAMTGKQFCSKSVWS